MGRKVWRAFFSQTKFNEKGIKVYERFAELRDEGFSVMEANCIVNNEVIQENSKHQKNHHFLTEIIGLWLQLLLNLLSFCPLKNKIRLGVRMGLLDLVGKVAEKIFTNGVKVHPEIAKKRLQICKKM